MLREFDRNKAYSEPPFYKDLQNLPNLRLKSIKPFWGSANVLSDVGFNTKDKWRNLRTDNNIANKYLVSDPTEGGGLGIPGS